MVPEISPMAFDVVAVTGGEPTVTSNGNVTNVPDPTTVLMVPAHRPAMKIKTASHQVTVASYARVTVPAVPTWHRPRSQPAQQLPGEPDQPGVVVQREPFVGAEIGRAHV